MPSPPTNFAEWSDEALFDLLRREKNERAFAVVVARYEVQVYGRCLKLTRNRDDAKDLTQDVFERFYRYLFGASDYVPFPQLLYRISGHRHIDLLRRKRFYVKAIQQWRRNHEKKSATFMEDGDFIRRTILAPERRKALDLAMGELPELQRQCLERFYFRQWSYAAIAEDLGVPLKRVKSALQNGKRRLRLHFLKSKE